MRIFCSHLGIALMHIIVILLLISISIIEFSSSVYAEDDNESINASYYEVRYLSRVQDAYAPAQKMPLSFVRTLVQDSKSTPYLGVFGRGWAHNYDIHIEELTDGNVYFYGPDSRRLFKRNNGGTYKSEAGDYSILTKDADGKFQLREKYGLIYKFKTDLRLDYMQDANENRVTLKYNDKGNLTEIEHFSGQKFNLEYNPQGRISKLVDQAGRDTIYEYSSDGSYLIRVIAPDGNSTSYAYTQKQGNIKDHRLESITYRDGSHKFFTYVSEGRLKVAERDDGIGRTTYSYNDDGETEIAYADGDIWKIRANERGLPLEISDPQGSTIHYEYDSNYNPILIIDQLGRTYSYTYDAKGNLIRIVDPTGSQIALSYESGHNRLNELRDSRGKVTMFSYDESGNLKRITYPDGSKEQFDCNTFGYLISKTDRKNQVIKYTYDNNGLLTSKLYPDGSSFIYSYDSMGRMKQARDLEGEIDFKYDIMDRVLSVMYPGNRTFMYAYDAAGRKTSMIDPDGVILKYKYDQTGRPIAIENESGSIVVSYNFSKAGKCIQKTLGNGAYSIYQQDPNGHLNKIMNYGPDGKLISWYNYTYDIVGNTISKETIEGKESYTYDDLDQLTSVTYSDGVKDIFTYDKMGNRISITQKGKSVEYLVNDLNQYEYIDSTKYNYDANGNLIEVATGGERSNYYYDYENRLIQVKTPTKTINYTYDAFGLLNSRSDSNGRVRYLWDDYQMAIEENNNHNTVTRFIYGYTLDEPIYMAKKGSEYYYMQDGQFSTTELTNLDGERAEHYIYNPFGEPEMTSSIGNPYLFTGRWYDVDAMLQYNRYRYYMPSLGRFITADPININGGFNLYMYAFNNPMRWMDPWGTQQLERRHPHDQMVEILQEEIILRLEIGPFGNDHDKGGDIGELPPLPPRPWGKPSDYPPPKPKPKPKDSGNGAIESGPMGFSMSKFLHNQENKIDAALQ